jgi:phosphate/sulfate permease
MDVTQHPPNGREIAMAEMALPGSIEPAKQHGPKLDHAVNPITAILFMGVLAAGILFVAYSIYSAYKGSLDNATKFIPGWVKIVVAIALGLGTMVGWKRIVVTVGSRIGKTHLTYAQGACAEITAAATIAAADVYGLPVSTTHVLSSGVAGTMAANGSGLQWATVRNIALAWVLTLPAAMALSGILYFLFSRLI